MFDQSKSQQSILPGPRPFPTRPFNQVDYQTQIDQLRQMIAQLQSDNTSLTVRVTALES